MSRRSVGGHPEQNACDGPEESRMEGASLGCRACSATRALQAGGTAEPGPSRWVFEAGGTRPCRAMVLGRAVRLVFARRLHVRRARILDGEVSRRRGAGLRRRDDRNASVASTDH